MEPIIQLTSSQLNEFAKAAGRAGGEAAVSSLTDLHKSALALMEQYGVHKAVMSTAEAARYANVSPGTIRKWIRDGMPATALGGRAGHQIRKTDLDNWRTRSAAQSTRIYKAS